MKSCLFLLLLIVIPLLTPAQSFRHSPTQSYHHSIDSLRVELGKAKVNTTRARLLSELGSYYYSICADSALLLCRQAVELARKTNDRELELICSLSLAKTLSEQNIPESMRMYFAVLQQAEQINARWIIRNCYFDIGIVQFYLQNYIQTITYFKRAKQMAQEDGDIQGTANATLDIGYAFMRLNQPDSARHYLFMAIRENPALEQDPYNLYYRGRLETNPNPAKARIYFQRSIRKLKAFQDWRGLAVVSPWYSECLFEQHQPDSSILIAKNGLQAAQRVGILRPVLSNSQQLAQVYRTLGKTDSAYKYQTIMLAARDSLFGQQKINQIQTTLVDEQQRIQALQDEKSRYESNVKIYGLLGLLLVVLGVAVLLYRHDRQKQRDNQQLQILYQAIGGQKEEIETQRDNLEQTLTELKTTQAQLIQKERLASLGELTAGIAHEIQNPLNFVNNFSEVSTELVEELKEGPFQQLPDSEKDYAEEILGDLTQNLQKITHHGGRASSIVKSMLEHSRPVTGERQATNLNALAEEYFRLAYQGLRAKDKKFNADLKTDFDLKLGLVNVVPQEIGRVMLNLYNNAFYAVKERQTTAPPDYQPTVMVSTIHRNGQAQIRVSDNGTGMPELVKAKIFQPFFTTKPTGEGTGLGLSLSYDIVTKGHGGSLTVESQGVGGTTFLIQLPTTNDM